MVSDIQDKTFATRKEALIELTRIVEDYNLKKRECVDYGLTANNADSVRTQVVVSHAADKNIKSPNTGFGVDGEAAILLTVVMFLAILTVFFAKLGKKSSKIFNFVLGGFLAIFMYFGGLNNAFAQEMECKNYGPYDMFFATIEMDDGGRGNREGYPKYKIILDESGDSSNYIEVKKHIDNNEDDFRKNMRESLTKFDREMFNSGELSFGFQRTTVHEVFNQYGVPSDERTFERLMGIPVWHSLIREDGHNYFVERLTYAERLEYEFNFTKQKLNDLLNEEYYKPLNIGEYKNQIFIRDSTVQYSV